MLRKSEKLECLHQLAAKVVDEFVFQKSSVVNDIVDSVLTQQEKDDLLQQELTQEGRFQVAGFPVATNHLSTMEPTVQLEEEPPTLTTSKPVSPPKETKERDDVFNYNCSLLTDSFLFF